MRLGDFLRFQKKTMKQQKGEKNAKLLIGSWLVVDWRKTTMDMFF